MTCWQYSVVQEILHKSKYFGTFKINFCKLRISWYSWISYKYNCFKETINFYKPYLIGSQKPSLWNPRKQNDFLYKIFI